MTVKLAKAEDDAKAAASAGREGPPGQLGLRMRSLTREERAQAHLDGGLLIEGVSGAAARAGLQPGDVLLAINGAAVNAVEQVREVMDRKARSVALLIDRGGDRIFVPVDLG
jgi:serine protease Do